ncbi:MAG: RcnB family protein [Sphingobium sp.]
MKNFILALAAATLTATPVLAAPGQPQQHQPRHEQSAHQAKAPAKTAKAHQWKRGERFDRNKATNYRVIGDPRAYKLQSAPKGYRWVQSGKDALLVRLSNNIISSVVTNAIR